MTSGEPPVRVGYITTRYPALSHSFIQHEIAGLRAAGAQVHTFAVRPSDPAHLMTPEMVTESRATTVLMARANRRELLAANREAARRHPAAYLRTLRGAVRTGEARPRARAYQAAYLAEATYLVRLMRERGIRHIHSHLAASPSDVGRLAVRLGRAVDGPDAPWRWTFTMHGPTEFEAVERFDLADKVRDADGVVCISDFCRSQLMKLSDPTCWDKLRTIHMSVDPDHYSPPAQPRTPRDDAFRIITVGRYVPEKGGTVLLDAVTQLVTAGLPVRVEMIGAGPMRERLEAEVAAKGLTGVVDIAGPCGQDQLPDRYRQADIFVLPSFQEGLPVVFMEAMATELPVVATRIAGHGELVVDGVNGRLVSAGRADLIASAVLDLARDPAARRRMGRAARQTVLAEFTNPANTIQLLHFFRNTLGTQSN